ncbi:MAG TPA: hypothetical protein VMZ91_08670, partial [Candidatus Paceibacterota bacterium]|nr:hypothetical protein [Candidatus Paceibacterota bacterium]
MGVILNEKKKRRKGKKKVILFILVSFIIIGLIGIAGYKFLQQPQSQSFLSNIKSDILNVVSQEATINPYHTNPELEYFNVEIDNGLKISDFNWSATIQGELVLYNDNVL